MGTKFEIKERAQNLSELSGDSNGRPFQCSHFNHNKNSQEYDNLSMGIYITDIEHFTYHLRFRNNPKRIGLSEKNNEEAIKNLWEGILIYNHMNMGEIYEKFLCSVESWDTFFDTRESIPQDLNCKQAIPPLVV